MDETWSYFRVMGSKGQITREIKQQLSQIFNELNYN